MNPFSHTILVVPLSRLNFFSGKIKNDILFEIVCFFVFVCGGLYAYVVGNAVAFLILCWFLLKQMAIFIFIPVKHDNLNLNKVKT